MNVLDILLLVAAVWFAIVGYRQGFVVGILSVIGFLGGGLVAVYLLPVIWDALTDDAEVGTTAAVVAVVVVIVCASVGQALTTHLGNKLRRYITWSPARALDATGGALVNVVAMLLVAWLIGSMLAPTTAMPTVGKEVRNSKVLLGVSEVLPDQADTWFTDFSSVLAQNGFPQVFSPFSDEPIKEVEAPDPALASSPVAVRAQRSIVKVTGTAESCGKVLEGTGFVFGQRRVMTNAHVVGGVDEPYIQIGGEGKRYAGKVVLYDWERDIAVLDVPDLRAPALQFTSQDAASGDSAIVAGFPENGPYTVNAARVRGRITPNGPDIYHRGTVRRDVYSLYANVRQGNSGGPLLTPDGKVYGVVFAKSLDDPETGYALTADEVQEDIVKGRTANQQVDSDSCAL
ncbi:MarP family serine protease [Streptomyces flaveus]|uniref:Serine protease n=1 Tax=Streptomyces flaveus TaxID=66370 RepID=A0A917VKR3_9ACTN|nr:MarP family serine protease [Streptomyces flaveus]GGK90589.1 serine protease [Streptomyces flaveus]